MRDGITRRDMLKRTLASSIAPGAILGMQRQAVAAPGRLSEGQPWFRKSLVGIEWGPTGANDRDRIYMSKSTGEQIVGMAAEADAEYIVVFMKDMRFAYYDSKLAQKCPSLGDRDLLRECIDAARPIDMPVVAYCQVQYDSSSWDAHPEWRMMDAAGNALQSRLCYRSGYLAYICDVLHEMMQYEIQGFHVDMLDFGFRDTYGCWCERCRSLFQEEFGHAMPSAPTWDESWDHMLRFRYASNLEFCQAIDKFIRETRPDISVDYNYHGYPPFSWEAGQRPVSHANNGDFVTAEGLPFVFGHTNPSLLALFLCAARPEGPIQIATSRSTYNYHDFTVRPEADLMWEAMTYMAHGVQCTVVDKADYDGGLDRVVYDRLGTIFREAKGKRVYFGHPPTREVGLYYSLRSRDWYGREDNPKYMGAVWGAHKALVQAHIPVSFLMDENVTLDRLRAFPVVYLAGTAIVTQDEVDLLKAYVSQGGKLLITGVSGWYDARGALRQQSSLEELIGARLREAHVEYPDNFIQFPGTTAEWAQSIVQDVPTDWRMMNWGPVGAYEPNSALPYGEVFTAYRSADNQWSSHMSAGPVVGPALLVNQLGEGTVICVAAAPDVAFAGNYRMPEHRNLIRNLIRHLHPEPSVRVTAPSQVECVITGEPGRTFVHLIFFAGAPTSAAESFPNGREVLPAVMEEPLPYEAILETIRPPHRAFSANAGTEISLEGNRVRIRVRAVHEVIVLEIDSA